jgi:hypothetical protein
MFGRPLNEDARNLKIEIQKEIIYYLRKKGSEKAKKEGSKKIETKHLQPIINNLSSYKKNNLGGFDYTLKAENSTISRLDYDQYSSVSYSYRLLLSVAQDLFLFSSDTLLSFNTAALELVNQYVNLLTLVTLKIADTKSREKNLQSITKDLISNSWVKVLKN